MTVRDLIKQLQDVDDDVLDYEVHSDVKFRLSGSTSLETQIRIISVFEDVDVTNKRLFLESYCE